MRIFRAKALKMTGSPNGVERCLCDIKVYPTSSELSFCHYDHYLKPLASPASQSAAAYIWVLL